MVSHLFTAPARESGKRLSRSIFA
eukprot:SAG22_NODE_14968_length_360_cov_1.137931_1_plen_23_part_10